MMVGSGIICTHLGDCSVCQLKERCTRAPFRKITRDINEEARDHARSLKGTPEFEQIER